MAHTQQAEFCKSVKQRFPEYFSNRLVLDVGSLDINGNNQFLFEDCQYIGIDLAPGRNVDFVTKGHELALPDESFDVVVSTECFEHDQFYARTLQNIVRMLKPGGLFFFSCATSGRPEHGTRRTTPHDAPFIQQMDDWSEYYKNLEEEDIRAVIDIEAIFSRFGFSTNNESKDLYFWGIKKGNLISRYDYSFQLSRYTFQEKIEKTDDTIFHLRSALHEQETSIRLLRDSLAAGESSIRLLQNSLVAKEASIQLLQDSLAAKDESILAQERRLSDFEGMAKSLRSEISSIRHSRSWRLTMPVRVLGRLARGEYSLIWSALRRRFKRSSDNRE